MFAGIIRAVGSVVGVERTARPAGQTPAYRLEVDLGQLGEELEPGASMAISGVCLTVVQRRGSVGSFDVVPETWERTTLRNLRPGDRVNLETSLRAGEPIHGHFVQGHVDGVGRVQRVDREHGQWKLWVQAESELMRAIVPKGAIALDGTSLTVVDVDGDRFSVALIPTTLQRTTLGRLRPGDLVNIETDILARAVLRGLEALWAKAGGPGVTLDRLRQAGFLP